MSQTPAAPHERTLEREVRSTRLILVAFLGASLLVALVAGLFSVLVSQPQVVRLTEITRSIRSAHEAMLDQQTGLRGYLATGDVSHIEPYRKARQRLRDEQPALGRRLTNEPELVELFVAMRLEQQEWMTFAEQARVEGPRTSRLVELFTRDDRTFAEYRRAQTALVDEVVERRVDALSSQRVLLIVVAVVQAISIIAALVALRRRMRRLGPLVTEPVQDVRMAMQQMQRGVPGVRVDPTGLRELRDVGAGFNEMASAIDEQTDLAEAKERDLVQHTDSLTQILRVSREIAGNLNVRYVLDAVTSACVAVSGADHVVIHLMDDDHRTLVPSHDSRGPGARMQADSIQLGEGPVGEAATIARRVSSPDGTTVAFPMVVGARVIGVLSFETHDRVEYPPRVLEVLETLATHSATAIEAARLHETTKELSTSDALTRLSNRRRFDEELKLEVDRSVRYQRPLALVMLDVDHFKSLNDSFGHQAGDEVLQGLALIMQEGLRDSDTAYRYGGEEFALLLRDTGIPEALEVAERIRATVERRFAAWRDDRAITVSLGVADITEGAEPTRLIGAADGALYRAKVQGRNRVMTSSEREPGDGHARGRMRSVE